MKCPKCKAGHSCSMIYCSRSDQGSRANGCDWHTCELRNCGETWHDDSLCDPKPAKVVKSKRKENLEPKWIPGERAITLNIETRVYFDGLTKSERPTGRIRGSGDWFPVPIDVIEKLTKGLDFKF